ncbi:hypothetical protein [Arcobacter vandammei]|uniref:hypothetical protein n=1 Tax=Arcobacter vandammei TaxID=2782243 RepID=UPI0018E021E2|nr:hypothetical protein [Arcobacter vandammei]
MEELVVTREELLKLFEDEVIKDTGKAWTIENVPVEIIALHDVEPKFLQDISKAEFYKIKIKKR